MVMSVLSGNLRGVSVDWAIVGQVLIALAVVSLVISIVWMAAASRRRIPRDRYQRTRPPYPS